jgi:hypothetical protein
MDVPCDTAQEGGDVAGGKSGLANSAPATAWQETLEKATKAVVVLKTTGTRCFDTDTAGSSYATGASVSFFPCGPAECCRVALTFDTWHAPGARLCGG